MLANGPDPVLDLGLMPTGEILRSCIFGAVEAIVVGMVGFFCVVGVDVAELAFRRVNSSALKENIRKLKKNVNYDKRSASSCAFSTSTFTRLLSPFVFTSWSWNEPIPDADKNSTRCN